MTLHQLRPLLSVANGSGLTIPLHWPEHRELELLTASPLRSDETVHGRTALSAQSLRAKGVGTEKLQWLMGITE